MDWVARTKGGAVMFERSPEMVAIDWSGQRHYLKCRGRCEPPRIPSMTIDSLLSNSSRDKAVESEITTEYYEIEDVIIPRPVLQYHDIIPQNLSGLK